MAKMRVSQHSGRQGSAAHNDRSFLRDRSADEQREIAPHIRAEDVQDNTLWGVGKEATFREQELAFYRQHYTAAQEATNARYRAQGHPERCKTVEQLYNGKLTRPEEMILQIGNRDAGADAADFKIAVDEYLRQLEEWNAAHGGHMHILNYAVHLDETSPHVHIRRVWDYTDKDGLTRLGQNKALEAAGVSLPKPDKPESRYNNRKMSFDAMARGMWQEVARSMGYDIETEPRPDLRHKDKAEFIAGQMERNERTIERQEGRIGAQERHIKANTEAITKQEAYQERLYDAAEHARDQKMTALRERDAARADRDVVKQLQKLQNAVFKPVSTDIEVLSRTEAKTPFMGRERPATVTIRESDFDSLVKQADVGGKTRQAANQMTQLYNGMVKAAERANMNRIDLERVAIDSRVVSLEERAEGLERDLFQAREALSQERDKTKHLSGELEAAKDKADTLDRLTDAFPVNMQRLLDIEALERKYDRKGRLSRSELSQYADLCDKAHIGMHDGIRDAIEHPHRDDFGLSL